MARFSKLLLFRLYFNRLHDIGETKFVECVLSLLASFLPGILPVLLPSFILYKSVFFQQFKISTVILYPQMIAPSKPCSYSMTLNQILSTYYVPLFIPPIPMSLKLSNNKQRKTNKLFTFFSQIISVNQV